MVRKPPRRKCTEVVIFLILLVWWLDVPKMENEPFQVVEFFSGAGRIAGFSKRVGLRSAAVDIQHGDAYAASAGKRSPMDINSDAGLVPLVSKNNQVLILFHLQIVQFN